MPHDYQGTITHLINALKAGDRQAMDGLWEVYFDRLMQVAQTCMRGMPKQARDEEDVLISVFHSLWQESNEQRLAMILSRTDLWKHLIRLTSHKATDHVRKEHSQKRDKRKTTELEDLQIVSREPSPEFIAELNDSVNCFAIELGDSTLRQVFVLHMEGYTVKEVADHLELSVRSVQRKLALISMKREQDCGVGPTSDAEYE